MSVRIYLGKPGAPEHLEKQHKLDRGKTSYHWTSPKTRTGFRISFDRDRNQFYIEEDLEWLLATEYVDNNRYTELAAEINEITVLSNDFFYPPLTKAVYGSDPMRAHVTWYFANNQCVHVIRITAGKEIGAVLRFYKEIVQNKAMLIESLEPPRPNTEATSAKTK